MYCAKSLCPPRSFLEARCKSGSTKTTPFLKIFNNIFLNFLEIWKIKFLYWKDTKIFITVICLNLIQSLFHCTIVISFIILIRSILLSMFPLRFFFLLICLLIFWLFISFCLLCVFWILRQFLFLPYFRLEIINLLLLHFLNKLLIILFMILKNWLNEFIYIADEEFLMNFLNFFSETFCMECFRTPQTIIHLLFFFILF